MDRHREGANRSNNNIPFWPILLTKSPWRAACLRMGCWRGAPMSPLPPSPHRASAVTHYLT